MRLSVLVKVPLGIGDGIFPGLAPAGTAIRMKFAVNSLKRAPTAVMVTSLVPTKCDP
jgi:hypothetical protein